VAAAPSPERQIALHFRHHFEVIAFHAVGATNGVEIGHSDGAKTRDSVAFRSRNRLSRLCGAE
jgi:hypothetical protein